MEFFAGTGAWQPAFLPRLKDAKTAGVCDPYLRSLSGGLMRKAGLFDPNYLPASL
jgi:hypothetical protein